MNIKRTGGDPRHELYYVWVGMIRRCHDTSRKDYKNYGGIGIKVCKSWHDFRNFIEDMGPRPVGYQIERIDNNKGYNKENCMWATTIQQANNRKTNISLEAFGRKQNLKQWADEFGISRVALSYRIRKTGLTIEEALTTNFYKGNKFDKKKQFIPYGREHQLSIV